MPFQSITISLMNNGISDKVSNAILSGYMVGFWSYMVKYEMNEVYTLSTLYSLKINPDKYGITISFYGHE